jgi:D-glycero-D-manno-heptose 1,7-bisphosphate phosphatase
MKKMVQQAVFLVGGKGTRLGSMAASCPKPLLGVGGRPFLDYLVGQVQDIGVRHMLFLAGHCADQVFSYAEALRVRSPAMTIEISVEPELAGTAGGLYYARERLHDAFFLFNGDSFFDCQLNDLMGADRDDPCLARIALRDNPDLSRYGAVQVADGRVKRFLEKGATGGGMMNAGIYLLRRQILDHIGLPPVSLESTVFPRLALTGDLAGTVLAGYFIDIGVPEDFARAQTEIPVNQFRNLEL